MGHRPLRLLFFCDPTEVPARAWMDSFVARGHHVAVIVDRESEIGSDLDPAIQIIRLNHGEDGRRWRVTSRQIHLIRAVRAAVRTFKPDVVHAHSVSGHSWRAWVSGFRPYVVSAWGSDVYIGVYRSWKSRAYGYVSLAGAAIVTTESRDVGRAAIAAGARRGRVARVQFGVDTSQFYPMGRPTDLAVRYRVQDRRVVFSPRIIAPLYRQQDVVRAISMLPDDVVLFLTEYKAQTDELRELRDLISRLGIASRVQIIPPVHHADMPALYALANVVVTVPSSDSTAITLLEALACGRPVVASDLPSPREWVADIWPELLVPVGDIERMAGAIDTALRGNLSDVAGRIGRGRSLVETAGSRGGNMDSMEAMYSALVKRRR